MYALLRLFASPSIWVAEQVCLGGVQKMIDNLGCCIYYGPVQNANTEVGLMRKVKDQELWSTLSALKNRHVQLQKQAICFAGITKIVLNKHVDVNHAAETGGKKGVQVES